MAGGIFISYRRDDSRHAAGRLVDRLRQAFNEDQLFMDVDNIGLGLDFVKVLQDKVGACDVMLVVIGPQWLHAQDEQGQRRLDDMHDFVRLEVEVALARDVRVVPIFIDGAQPPRPEELPPSLQPLVRRQATTIAHDRFGADADRIVAALQRIVSAETHSSQTISKSKSVTYPPIGSEIAAASPAPRITPKLILSVATIVGPLEKTFYSPDIPGAKAENARACTGMPARDQLLILFDNTVFGSAKNCLALGVDGLYYRNMGDREFASWDQFLAHPIVQGALVGLKIGGSSWTFANPPYDSIVAFLSRLRTMAAAGD